MLTLTAVARRLGISASSVRNYDDALRPERTPGGSRRYKEDAVAAFEEQLKSGAGAQFVREARADYQASDDPLEALIGICDDPEGPSDESVNHDTYLYGAPPSRA